MDKATTTRTKQAAPDPTHLRTEFPSDPKVKVIYLSGVAGPEIDPVLTAPGWCDFHGILSQPATYGEKTVAAYPRWAADNGCFSSTKTFDAARWIAWLESFSSELRASCMWATAPDVVGDAEATLVRSLPYLDEIKARGYRVAFVAQDGSETDLDRLIPWDKIDTVFLGGSTEWKLDPERAGRVAAEALRRGKTVHMGRVNSKKRMLIAESFGCESADGTLLAFGPRWNLPRLLKWRT